MECGCMSKKVNVEALEEARREIILEQVEMMRPKVEMYYRATIASGDVNQRTLAHYEK